MKVDARFGEEGENIFASCSTAIQVAEALSKYTDNSDIANAFANVAAQHLTGTPTAIGAEATSVELAAGYYLLVDSSSITGNDAKNSALLQVTNKGNVTIAAKYTVPTVNKSVQDSDNSWGEAADYEIGSNVLFKIVGTLPDNYANYETYKYVFHDTMSANLQLNANLSGTTVTSGVTVKVGDNDITTNFTITYSNNNLTVSCNNLKAISNVTKDSQITVEYIAKLLATAEIGNPGNENKVYLEYSNDPNTTGSGTTSNTPEDKVLVFTYELDVTKVDGQDEGTKLQGAEFVLLNSDRSKVAKVSNGKFVEWVPDSSIGKNSDGTYPADYTLTSDTAGLFKVAGLDAGTYYLKETKAPVGYNLLSDPIKIVISATLDKSENNPALTSLKITVNDGTPADGNLNTGVVSTTVNNNSGATLPETGGMGTTIFYAAGSILVLAAVVLLVTRKRMDAKN